MTLQNAVAVTVAYGAEAVAWGTPATAGGTSKYIRRVQSTLNGTRDLFQSQEARPDQQVYDARLGTNRAVGGIEGELSLTTFDDWLAAAIRGAWVAGTSKTNTEFTSMTAANATSKLTVGGSTWAAEGFRVGDVIRLTGMSVAGNNSVNFQITALSGVDATVYPAPTDNTADTSFTVAVVGYKAINGVLTPSFTIEQRNPDLDVSERYDGMRVNNTQVRIPANGMATVTFDFMGKSVTLLTAGSSPYFSSITAAPATSLLAGPNGFTWALSDRRTIVTGLDFTIANQLSDTPVIGDVYVPEIFYGTNTITGNFQAYFEDDSFFAAFLAETEIDLMVRLDAPAVGSSPSEFLSFVMTRVKITSHQKSVGPNGGVIASFGFQALLKGTATGYDSTTLMIQRSI